MMKYTPDDGSAGWEQEAYHFKGPGCLMGMYNTSASINTFAKICF